MGRQSHSSFHQVKEVVSASDVKVDGETHIADGTKAPYETPRPLTVEEIAQVVGDYKNCATLAKQAGFDGVEVHAANGYLIDQFLQTCSNKRTD